MSVKVIIMETAKNGKGEGFCRRQEVVKTERTFEEMIDFALTTEQRIYDIKMNRFKKSGGEKNETHQ